VPGVLWYASRFWRWVLILLGLWMLIVAACNFREIYKSRKK
jgi:hypothetical protein